jgi:hypothetical protein
MFQAVLAKESCAGEKILMNLFDCSELIASYTDVIYRS